MDTVIERQAIRTAITLAAASAFGSDAQAISELRDEATQLILLCMYERHTHEDMMFWCEGASAIIDRFASNGYIPEDQALTAASSVLRLQLIVSRRITEDRRASDAIAKKESKREDSTPKERPKKPVVVLEGNAKELYAHIEAHPDVRTRDLISFFVPRISSRTVKRHLKDLIDLKQVIRKTLTDGGVAYRVDSDA